MRPRRFALFAVVLLAVALLARPNPAAAEEVLVDGIAAQVGNEIVLISEVMELVASRERTLRSKGASENDIALIRSDGLESVIESRLLDRVIRDAKLGATDAEVDATIEAIARENNISVVEIQKAVVAQQMQWADYRKQIRQELERRKVVNAVLGSKITIDDDDVETLYRSRYADQPEAGTEIHLRQILVPANEEGGVSLAEACRLAGRARERVVKGEPFDQVASRYSVVAVQRGGDLGWVHLDSVAGWMAEIIEPLRPGEISKVHELPIACTFVQVVDRKEWKPVSLEASQDALRQEIYEEKLMAEYREWMEELRDQTFIERRGYFADAARFRPESGKSEFEAGLSGESVLQKSPEAAPAQ